MYMYSVYIYICNTGPHRGQRLQNTYRHRGHHGPGGLLAGAASRAGGVGQANRWENRGCVGTRRDLARDARHQACVSNVFLMFC